jgi:hypothetical protein
MRIELTIPDQSQEPPDLKSKRAEIRKLADRLLMLRNPHRLLPEVLEFPALSTM